MRIAVFFFVLIPFLLGSQNVRIQGRADSSYAGKVITLSRLSDFVTALRQKEMQDTIDSEGYFELAYHASGVEPVFITIGRAVAQLYVRPDFVYGIRFPPVDESRDYKNGAELQVNLTLVGAADTELNTLINDFQILQNRFFAPEDGRFLSRGMIFRLADSLQKICNKKYASITDPYFTSYVRYAIATINAGVSRGENYLINGYILNSSVQHRHYEYMQFFNTCFKGYLNGPVSQRGGTSVFHIINRRANYQELNNFLRQDRFLKNDTVRELAILRNLWDFYFSGDYDVDAIESIVTQLSQQTRVLAHRAISENMLAYMNKLQAGSSAPPISARTKDGKIGTLENFRGRWVYVNFFSTQNIQSLREMPKIASLKKQYGDKVVFLSICMDDSLSTYKEYLRRNPRLDWAIWYNNEPSLTRKAADNYYVTGSEAYFLINSHGDLVQTPALSPSGGIEYKFNMIFKIRRRNTKTGIR